MSAIGDRSPLRWKPSSPLASGARTGGYRRDPHLGRQTRDVLDALCGGMPKPRHASLREIGPPQCSLLDRGLVLWFQVPPASPERTCQLHVLEAQRRGSRDHRAVLSLAGTRLAEPGEFARRAFENGKLDLTEVEGPRRSDRRRDRGAKRAGCSLRRQGSLRRLYEGWRSRLLSAQALIEAGLEFANEGETRTDVSVKAGVVVGELLESISLISPTGAAKRLRDGLRIVIAVRPYRQVESAERAR